jgi:NodT family efflux transporter outer membrane factor (OMF) lipoprotein
MTLRHLLVPVLAAVLVAGCSLTPSVARVEAESRLPRTYGSGPDSALAPGITRWWTSFGDPVLDDVVDTVMARNRDLAIAALRVAEVQELYRVTRAARLPGAQLSVEGTRQSTPTNAGATGRFAGNIPGFPDRFDFTTYTASLGLSWELDFWGRVRDATRAAVHDFLATRADLDAARTGIAAEAVATYLEIADIESQLAVARETADLLAERSAAAMDRYQRGLASSFELYRIQQSLADARAAVPQLEAARHEARSRLAVLAGGFPSDLEAILVRAPRLPPLPDPVPAGLPSDLLANRPDLVAAGNRMEAARRRAGVARAERLPRLSLTAAGGTQSSDLEGLVSADQRFGLVTGSILQPVFQAGARSAASRAATLRYEQAVLAYDRAVLTAFREASAALVSLDRQRERYRALASALDDARSSERSQVERFRRGVGDYAALLDARINRLRAEAGAASGARAAALARLTVHRALGGAWTESDPR